MGEWLHISVLIKKCLVRSKRLGTACPWTVTLTSMLELAFGRQHPLLWRENVLTYPRVLRGSERDGIYTAQGMESVPEYVHLPTPTP